ncbi:hypothetical protein FN846DRAFT_976728 [Sphaerosporella brunnea]|uniref:Uncharacterized protein n=1 Tax=Sphaerosporella brunnea TaxID=1250544 RepID=A0A5J5EEA3_9PEZI|nr:hypothetical protein FN846DRAFT_976728 [Sphaerosporella brunnea]
MLSMPTPDPTVSPRFSSPQSSACETETVLAAVELFIRKERASLQAEIRRLQAENAALLKENGELLRRTISTSCSSPSSTATLVMVDAEKGEKMSSPEPRDDLVATLVEKVHHYQRFLLKERETSALREASFDQSFHVLHKTVKDSLRPASQHHLCARQGHTTPASGVPDLGHMNTPPLSPKISESMSQSDPLVNKVIELSFKMSQRAAEMKRIRQLAESKAEQAASRIAQLERKSEGLSLLQAHNKQVDLELDVLKLRLKKLETLALEYVPLVEQDILLDFEAYKDELLKVQTRQKQRRKKEARWNLWRADLL